MLERCQWFLLSLDRHRRKSVCSGNLVAQESYSRLTPGQKTTSAPPPRPLLPYACRASPDRDNPNPAFVRAQPLALSSWRRSALRRYVSVLTFPPRPFTAHTCRGAGRVLRASISSTRESFFVRQKARGCIFGNAALVTLDCVLGCSNLVFFSLYRLLLLTRALLRRRLGSCNQIHCGLSRSCRTSARTRPRTARPDRYVYSDYNDLQACIRYHGIVFRAPQKGTESAIADSRLLFILLNFCLLDRLETICFTGRQRLWGHQTRLIQAACFSSTCTSPPTTQYAFLY